MNKLSKDKQIQVVSALLMGNSLRSVSRMTGVHRETITRIMGHYRSPKKKNQQDFVPRLCSQTKRKYKIQIPNKTALQYLMSLRESLEKDLAFQEGEVDWIKEALEILETLEFHLDLKEEDLF